MADDADDSSGSNGPQNLLKNTDPKKRAAIAATFGGPSADSDDKGPKLAAMKRRLGP